MTAKNVSLLFLGISSPLMCLAFFVGGPALEILFALLSAAWPVALIALGIDRRGGLGPLRWVLSALLGLLVASVVGLLMARGGVLDDPWILGLPLATAIEVYGILRTMYDPRVNLSNEVSLQLIKHFDRKVFRTVIPRNIRLAEAPSFGQTIFDYAPWCAGANDYRKLAEGILAETDPSPPEVVTIADAGQLHSEPAGSGSGSQRVDP